MRILDFGFWIDSTDKSGGLYHQEILGQLEDIFDARDITELVYRTMRDLMTTEASDRVEAELHTEVLQTDDQTLQKEIADLWKDTNPLVGLLSRVRPPWQGPAPFVIDSNLFIFRVEQEGPLPSGVKPETAIAAVFSATKDELSEERIHEIAGFLPDRILKIWESASGDNFEYKYLLTGLKNQHSAFLHQKLVRSTRLLYLCDRSECDPA
ncbi:MAG: DUF2267 domain-containing protein [Microcoleus sp.]